MPEGNPAEVDVISPETAEEYVALLRQRREAELALRRARLDEVDAKRQWHERARKAADFKSKFRAFSAPEALMLPVIAFRPLGVLYEVHEPGERETHYLRVQRPYARGLRGIESFEYVWLCEAHATLPGGKELAESGASHGLRLRLYNLVKFELLNGDDCTLHLAKIGPLQSDDSTNQSVQVVDIKPYIPKYDSLRVLSSTQRPVEP